jgi:hypothetical protein
LTCLATVERTGTTLEHLAASDLSPKTIQKHVDNVWAPGGEFMRDLHNDPSLRKKSVDLVLHRMIEYGGPLLSHGGEDQQRSFDSTCRKLRRFLTETARESAASPTNSPDEAKKSGTSCRILPPASPSEVNGARCPQTKPIHRRVPIEIQFRPWPHVLYAESVRITQK